MRFTLLNEEDAPKRSSPRHEGKRQLELISLVDGLRPDTVARIEGTAVDSFPTIRSQIYRAAARLGRWVEVWEVDGAVYAGLVSREEEGRPGT